MMCPNCASPEGNYSNIEDFNPGSDPEWSYYECWTCLDCGHTIYSYEDDFEYGDEND